MKLYLHYDTLPSVPNGGWFGLVWGMKLSRMVQLALANGGDPASEIEDLQRQMEGLDRTVEQLQRRMEALTGPSVDHNTAKSITETIQRRIDAVNKDKEELQARIEELKDKQSQKCECPVCPEHGKD